MTAWTAPRLGPDERQRFLHEQFPSHRPRWPWVLAGVLAALYAFAHLLGPALTLALWGR